MGENQQQTQPTESMAGLNLRQSHIAGGRRVLSPLCNPLSQGQRAKKVVSDSTGLVEFAIGLVNSVINFPDGQVIFFEEIE